MQAFTHGHGRSWVTDCRTVTLDEAIEKAVALHEDFRRAVRVVDDDEVIHFRLGTTVRRS